MTIYRNSKGVTVSVVSLRKKNRQFWVVYRPVNLAYNCTMLRCDFYRDFKLVHDVVEGQQP